MKLEPSSKYWLVRVDATNEEKNFKSLRECKIWADKVKLTFCDQNMTFTVTEVTERTGSI